VTQNAVVAVVVTEMLVRFHEGIPWHLLRRLPLCRLRGHNQFQAKHAVYASTLFQFEFLQLLRDHADVAFEEGISVAL
jgi:hypothetical protein